LFSDNQTEEFTEVHHYSTSLYSRS